MYCSPTASSSMQIKLMMTAEFSESASAVSSKWKPWSVKLGWAWGGKEIITALVEPYTAHYTQMIDYSAYLITVVRVVSCFLRAGVAPPLRFPLGLLCRFSANDMTWNFFRHFSFGLIPVSQQVDVFTSSLQVIIDVIVIYLPSCA